MLRCVFSHSVLPLSGVSPGLLECFPTIFLCCLPVRVTVNAFPGGGGPAGEVVNPLLFVDMLQAVPPLFMQLSRESKVPSGVKQTGDPVQALMLMC